MDAMQTRRNRVLLGLAGGLLLLAGLVAGTLLGGRLMTARAASATHQRVVATGSGPERYCQIYEQTLANDLNVSTSALEQANIDAAHHTLDQMVKDNQITSFEEAQIVQLLGQVGVQPCTKLNAQTITSFLQGDTVLAQQLVAARTALIGAVAGALGMSPADLQTALGQGQTVAQLATAHKVALSTVSAAYLSELKTLLAQDASANVITSDQTEYLYNAVAHFVNAGHFPLLDGQGIGTGSGG